MKKHVLALALIVSGSFCLRAQTAVMDSVSIGSANESWYKLSTGSSMSAARANWDLAFTTSGYDVTILFNHAVGNSVYIAAGATPATFTAVTQADTATTPLFNSDSTWITGALNQQPSGPYHYGWGNYNPSTHNVTGNRVFIVKYPGNTFKKFYIQELSNASMPYTYTLVYANIDNSGQQTVSIPKQTYGTKNFVYYSFASNAIVDREPAKAGWDLLFTKYTTTSELYMGASNQVVAGVLQNNGVLAAQANGVSNPASYTSYASHTFSTAINVLGWDWKGLNATFQYTVEPNRVYFVEDQNNDIYKVVFISYTGGSTGKFKFSKEHLHGSSIGINNAGTESVTMALYPNPAGNEGLTLLFSARGKVSEASVSVQDIAGKTIFSEALTTDSGLNQHLLNTASLQAGVYFVSLNVNGYQTIQKFIKQ